MAVVTAGDLWQCAEDSTEQAFTQPGSVSWDSAVPAAAGGVETALQKCLNSLPFNIQ